MNRTKIDWADMTWNPVTGCLHGCDYCYARKIAQRFGNSFAPEMHRFRLSEPQSVKKPQNIFVCSMADLFGKWVPDEWIEAVFEACEKAPQHRYMFLTKNPKRYDKLIDAKILPRKENHWYGITVTEQASDPWRLERSDPAGHDEYEGYNMFASYEPMLGCVEWRDITPQTKWIILGTLTGTKASNYLDFLRLRQWIEPWEQASKNKEIKLFMKSSLAPIWGGELVREYPWEAK